MHQLGAEMIHHTHRKSIPIAREGFPFIATALALALLAALAHMRGLAGFFALLTLFVAYFFRDPERVTPLESNALVAPADGKVLNVQILSPGDNPLGIEVAKLSIFMSLFNVHVNRFPADGIVDQISYEPGKFFSANIDKASEVNEKNKIFLDSPEAGRILLVQIAGLIARRIVCWATKGQRVSKGQRLGLIRFGSRVEVYVPSTCRIVVKEGQNVKAGETIIGYMP